MQLRYENIPTLVDTFHKRILLYETFWNFFSTLARLYTYRGLPFGILQEIPDILVSII